ncbi:MAG: Fe-S cluster assembly ATPase SufC [SAR324 cluster bacterium]|uniref:Fe-S cluster assembly ATPase SufC n=1 Tax=SAR324 cluster bacterium TaxID=2024889 RepID=A0A7X9FTY2_9DELT|nr:Fe-S cluster assembly ATPase SufC [SAR324 cluster bacterium]
MTQTKLLEIKDLYASIESGQIIRGLSLDVRPGEIHAIMGPNGSGKSTLAKVLAGHPSYMVDSGEVLLNGENVLEMSPDERSKKGLFLAFQYPQEIPGVSILNFLRTAVNARLGKDMSVMEFRKLLYEKMDMLSMDRKFATRFVNDGFSGGEKKRNEILQMALLQPSLAVLDETDSGLDIDALRIVSQGVNKIMEEANPKPGVLVITHYNRILNYIQPDYVHVLYMGQIIKSGSSDLALELEERGYDWLIEGRQAGAAV